MQLVNTVTGKNSAIGQVIDFRVTNDIVVDGKTVIPAGSIAKAQVTRAKKMVFSVKMEKFRLTLTV